MIGCGGSVLGVLTNTSCRVRQHSPCAGRERHVGASHPRVIASDHGSHCPHADGPESCESDCRPSGRQRSCDSAVAPSPYQRRVALWTWSHAAGGGAVAEHGSPRERPASQTVVIVLGEEVAREEGSTRDTDGRDSLIDMRPLPPTWFWRIKASSRQQ